MHLLRGGGSGKAGFFFLWKMMTVSKLIIILSLVVLPSNIGYQLKPKEVTWHCQSSVFEFCNYNLFFLGQLSVSSRQQMCG